MSDTDGGEPTTSPDILRTMIQHEDALRDQRLGWMFALNGFLFTALGFIWNDSKALSLIIASLGAAIAVSSFATLRVSTLAVRALRMRAPQPPLGDNIVVGLRGEVLEGHATDAERQALHLKPLDRLIPILYSWRAAPIFLFGAWVAVLVARSVD